MAHNTVTIPYIVINYCEKIPSHNHCMAPKGPKK